MKHIEWFNNLSPKKRTVITIIGVIIALALFCSVVNS